MIRSFKHYLFDQKIAVKDTQAMVTSRLILHPGLGPTPSLTHISIYLGPIPVRDESCWAQNCSRLDHWAGPLCSF